MKEGNVLFNDALNTFYLRHRILLMKTYAKIGFVCVSNNLASLPNPHSLINNIYLRVKIR